MEWPVKRGRRVKTEWPVASELVECGETAPEVSQSSFVGQDSSLVLDDSSNDKIGILLHEETHAAGQIGQGLTGDVVTPENAPNKANPQPKQCAGPQARGSRKAGAKKAREQSQSERGASASETGVTSGPRPMASEVQENEPRSPRAPCCSAKFG